MLLFVLHSSFATSTGHDASMEQHVIKQIQVLTPGMATYPSINGIPGTVGYQPSILAKQVHSWGTWHEGGWSQKQHARATGSGSVTCPIFLFQSFGYKISKNKSEWQKVSSLLFVVSKHIPQISHLNIQKAAMNLQAASNMIHDAPRNFYHWLHVLTQSSPQKPIHGSKFILPLSLRQSVCEGPWGHSWGWTKCF